MPPDQRPVRRADAERNRAKVLEAARGAFLEPDGEVSMAEVARRAGVGMATLYRNFPSRRELLEALYVDEVDALCAPGEPAAPGAAFTDWLRRFFAFSARKRQLAAELLQQPDTSPVLGASRARVLAAGAPLLAAAQAAGEVRDDLTLEQVLDMVIAIGAIRGDRERLAPILQTALDGLRPPGSSGPTAGLARGAAGPH